MNLTVQIAPKHKKGLLLKNPVMAGSGTFGYGTEYSDVFDVNRLGAIVCKGTTLKPRAGNPQPRLVETAGGVLNSIGLENIGVEALVREKAPVWAGWQVLVIVNIAGETVAEYVRIASALEGVEGVSGIEVNISCPNVKAGGMEFGTSARTAARLVKEIRAITTLPLIVKLTPNVTDITEIARAAAGAGADALTLINTAKVNAYFHERDFVIPEDIKELSEYTIPHRVLFKEEYETLDKKEIIRSLIETIPTPA